MDNNDIKAAVFILLLILFCVFAITGKELWNNIPSIITLVIIALAFTALAGYMYNQEHHKQSKSVFDNILGSADDAKDEQIEPYREAQKGLYIGGGDIFFQEQGHCLTVAGSRSGKGTNLIIPNLLGAADYNGSWVIIDPKGENTAITANYQQQIGRDVFILDPFQELIKIADEDPSYAHLKSLPFAQFNPLDGLDPHSDELVDDVDIIAEIIVPLTSGEHSHWHSRARAMIAGMLLHLVTSLPKEEQTLFKLYQWLHLDETEFITLAKEMQYSEACYGVISAAGNDILFLLKTGEKEFSGILSTAKDHTNKFKSPGIIRSTGASSFDITQLAKRQMTLYIILPSDKIETHRFWLIICIRTALNAVTRNRGHRVAFIMDEFHSLGYLKVIEKSMGRLPGFNITLWPILQDLNQLKGLYKDSWETFITNSRVRYFFGIGDNFTADYVSKRTGEKTVVTWQEDNDQQATGYRTNKRFVMTPNEVIQEEKIITFIDNLPVALLDKKPYYDWEEIRQRAQSNPYHTND